MDANAKELERLLAIAKIVQDAIKELGEVPSGHLYANLSGHMNLKTYQSIIALLKEAKVIREEKSSAHLGGVPPEGALPSGYLLCIGRAHADPRGSNARSLRRDRRTGPGCRARRRGRGGLARRDHE
jgi:hypothetical protein